MHLELLIPACKDLEKGSFNLQGGSMSVRKYIHVHIYASTPVVAMIWSTELSNQVKGPSQLVDFIETVN